MALLVDRPRHISPADRASVLYEWLVEDGGPSGRDVTPCAAMQALSRALLRRGGGYGVVRPLEQVHLARLGVRYLPCNPLHRAICERGVIRWL